MRYPKKWQVTARLYRGPYKTHYRKRMKLRAMWLVNPY